MNKKISHIIKRHLSAIVLIVITTIGNIANAQAVVQLETDTIALGDQTVLSIRNALNYPSSEMLTNGGIVALSQTFDTASRTQRTVITCFEPGEHYIHLSPEDSIRLIVKNVDIDTASMEPRDIMPLEKIPYSFWEIFRWVLLLIALGAIAFAVWWLVTHRKTVEKVFGISEPVDTRTAEEKALDRLEKLRRNQLWQSGNVKDYHTELTDIVRMFIEEVTTIHATEMTSDETIDSLKVFLQKRETVDISLLSEIFTTADLVKFAKNEPLANVHERSMSNAVQFVKELWLSVKPEEKEGSDA